jgi:hypothetical protein
MARYFDLTTISQDVWDQGRQIAQHLVDAVARPGKAPVLQLRAPTRLVVRGTTAVLGVEQRSPSARPASDDPVATDKRRETSGYRLRVAPGVAPLTSEDSCL